MRKSFERPNRTHAIQRGTVATIALVAALPTAAQTNYTWTDGASGSNWSNSSNWSGGSGVPNATDHFVIFPQRGGDDEVNLNNGDWTVGGITFNHTSNLYTIRGFSPGSGIIDNNLRNHGNLTNTSGGYVRFWDNDVQADYYQTQDGVWNLHSDPSRTVFDMPIDGSGKITLNGGVTFNERTGFGNTIEINGTARVGSGNELSNTNVILNADDGIDLQTNGVDASVRTLEGSGRMFVGTNEFTVNRGNGKTFDGDIIGSSLVPTNSYGRFIVSKSGEADYTLTGNVAGIDALKATNGAHIILDNNSVILNNVSSDGGLVIEEGGITLNGGSVRVDNQGRVNVDSFLLTISGGTLSAGQLTGRGSGGTIDLTDPTAGEALTVGIASGTSYTSAYNGTLTGTGSMRKVGTGDLTLNQGNSFSGDAFIDNGSIILGHNRALQNATVQINTDNGLDLSTRTTPFIGALSGSGDLDIGTAALDNGGNGASTTYSGNLSGTGSFIKSGSGDLTLAAVNTFAGTTIVDNGSIILGNANTLANSTVEVNANNGLDINGLDANIGGLAGIGSFNLGTQTVTVGGNDADTTYAGTFAGSGTLLKAGNGTLSLAGGFNGTGEVRNLTTSKIEITGSGSFGKVTTTGGTLDIFGGAKLNLTSGDANPLYLANAVGTIRDAANVELTNTAADTRVILFNGSTLNVSDTGTTLIAPRIAVGLSGNANPSTFTAEQSASVLANRLDIGDLGNNHGSSGSFIIKTNATVTADSVVIYDRGTLEINNGQLFANTFNDLSSTPQAINLTSSANKEALVIGGSGGSSTIHNVLQDGASGSGAIRKDGTGPLELTAANTYSRGTNITGGTLFANNATGSATGTGIVLVRDTATLAGDGSVGGRVFVYAGGTVAPGNSPGLLSVGGEFDLSTGSTLQIELAGLTRGTEYDALDILGDVDLANATLDLILLNNYQLTPEQTFNIIDVGGALTGQFNGLDEGSLVATNNASNLYITYQGGDGNNVALYTQAVPEPTSLALLSLGGILLTRRRR